MKTEAKTLVCSMALATSLAFSPALLAASDPSSGSAESSQEPSVAMMPMNRQMLRMQEQVEQLHATTNPAERHELMRAHARSMQGMMQMMHGMMASQGMMGPGAMGPGAMGPGTMGPGTTGQGTMGPGQTQGQPGGSGMMTPGQMGPQGYGMGQGMGAGAGAMMGRVNMMEQRMNMMQMMMDQMLEQQQLLLEEKTKGGS